MAKAVIIVNLPQSHTFKSMRLFFGRYRDYFRSRREGARAGAHLPVMPYACKTGRFASFVAYAATRSCRISLVEPVPKPHFCYFANETTNNCAWDARKLNKLGWIENGTVSKELSARLNKTVFSLPIHDGDLWMLLLYKTERRLGGFPWAKVRPGL